MKKEWSERRDSNPRPLPPQSRPDENNKQFQGVTAAFVFGSFLIGSCQSVASLWPLPLPVPPAPLVMEGRHSIASPPGIGRA
jgi:hypothetical protein